MHRELNWELNDFEKIILLSANGQGVIPFPQGPATHIEAILVTLIRMQEKGLLFRKKSYEFDRPFHLTPAGRSLKQELFSEEPIQHQAA